ncbi:MAG: segregation/condensation protein A [Calditrichia bacterium]
MYKIKLPVFEGPFDLLLFLIRKNEIDIYDIPIAQITKEYLEYIELMKMLDLEIAGEFIEMVATLILIKTRMLLPQQATEGEEDPEDPRLKLTLQLLEYKRFKEKAEELYDIESERRQFFSRASTVQRQLKKFTPPDEEFVVDATLFDLLTAFKKALDNMPKITVHRVNPVKISIEDQVRFIFDSFAGGTYVHFGEITKSLPTKIHVIVTFMSILDLMRLQMITCKQDDAFGDIRLVALTDLSMSHFQSLREEQQLHLSDEPETPPENEQPALDS